MFLDAALCGRRHKTIARWRERDNGLEVMVLFLFLSYWWLLAVGQNDVAAMETPMGAPKINVPAQVGNALA